jgi:type III pantothenate kinase
MSNFPFLAVDIGNARIKIGLFRRSSGDGLPEPERILPLDGDRPPFERIDQWLNEISPPVLSTSLSWFIASVNRPSATRLVDWLSRHRPEDRVVLLSAADLPLEVRLQRPDMVGIDRLVDAVAVNRLRNPNSPAAIVDVGSAITVDLVSRGGAFLGGSILPGLAMSARAMHEFTDLLPLIETDDLREPPPALGADTEEAMRSGLFWGAIGAIRQLVEELGRQASLTNDISHDAHSSVEVFLTGGAGVTVASLLGPNARHIPHLTLAGIALSATERLF